MKEKGIDNVTVDDLIEEVTPRARGMSLLQLLIDMPAQSPSLFISYASLSLKGFSSIHSRKQIQIVLCRPFTYS